MADIERLFITSVIDNEALGEALEARINVGYFQGEDNAAVWEWLRGFYSEYGLTPSTEALFHQFPKFELEETPGEPLVYYINQIRELHKRSLFADALIEAKDYFDEGDINDALRWMAQSLADINLDTSGISDRDLTESADTWLDAYLEEVRSGKWFNGITSGFPFIDRALGGLQKQQLITLVGLPKAGKSTSILWSNICAHMLSYKTMFVTFEMTNDEQELRHHTFRAGIHYNRLKFGKLTAEETRRLRKMLNGMSAMHGTNPMLFVHDRSAVTTVSGLAAKIAEVKPDIAYVDGVYLMDSEIPGVDPGSPQALTSITRGLKKLAQRADIPIVCSTQVLPSKYSARAGIRMGDIGYTSSFAQDSDAIFGVEVDPQDPKYMIMSVVAARNAPPGKARYVIDWEVGNIEEVDEEFSPDDEDDSVDQ